MESHKFYREILSLKNFLEKLPNWFVDFMSANKKPILYPIQNRWEYIGKQKNYNFAAIEGKTYVNVIDYYVLFFQDNRWRS